MNCKPTVCPNICSNKHTILWTNPNEENRNTRKRSHLKMPPQKEKTSTQKKTPVLRFHLSFSRGYHPGKLTCPPQKKGTIFNRKCIWNQPLIFLRGHVWEGGYKLEGPLPVINGSYNPYKRIWIGTRVVTPTSGVTTLLITGRGPPCIHTSPTWLRIFEKIFQSKTRRKPTKHKLLGCPRKWVNGI